MPKGWRSYVGVTFGKDDVLPRNERAMGRERVFLGHQLNQLDSTGVFDFVPTEGEEEEGTGSFKERKAAPVEIPKVRGRVVNGEIVPGEVIAAAAAAAAASSGESASASL